MMPWADFVNLEKQNRELSFASCRGMSRFKAFNYPLQNYLVGGIALAELGHGRSADKTGKVQARKINFILIIQNR